MGRNTYSWSTYNENNDADHLVGGIILPDMAL